VTSTFAPSAKGTIADNGGQSAAGELNREWNLAIPDNAQGVNGCALGMRFQQIPSKSLTFSAELAKHPHSTH
jgi:hypothetical protein